MVSNPIWVIHITPAETFLPNWRAAKTVAGGPDGRTDGSGTRDRVLTQKTTAGRPSSQKKTSRGAFPGKALALIF